MKTYTLFWLSGETELVRGYTITEAVKSAGYNKGAIYALDFYGKGDLRDNYAWDPGAKSWEEIKS